MTDTNFLLHIDSPSEKAAETRSSPPTTAHRPARFILAESIVAPAIYSLWILTNTHFQSPQPRLELLIGHLVIRTKLELR